MLETVIAEGQTFIWEMLETVEAVGQNFLPKLVSRVPAGYAQRLKILLTFHNLQQEFEMQIF